MDSRRAKIWSMLNKEEKSVFSLSINQPVIAEQALKAHKAKT
jgi:hypothetical protein